MGSGGFDVYIRPDEMSEFIPGDRIQVTIDGAKVYEGFVSSIERKGNELSVELVGAWGQYIESVSVDRRYCDKRLTQDAWTESDDDLPGRDKCHIDRYNRIRFTPKAEQWAQNENVRVRYDMPTGELAGRVKFNYDFAEDVQNWELNFGELDTPTEEFTVTATATGSQDITLGTPASALYFEFNDPNASAQTPDSDGSVYGQVSNVRVYAYRAHPDATVGTVSAYEVALDIVYRFGYEELLISKETDELSTMAGGRVVEPFITRGPESWGSVAESICSYGATDDSPLYMALGPSWLSADMRPKLILDSYPVATDYDYAIEANEVNATLDTDTVYNQVYVRYTDDSGGGVKVAGPYTDADSIALYGTRTKTFYIGGGGAGGAEDAGTRYLERHKSPTWRVLVPGYISGLVSKAGEFVPAHSIQAGKRLKILGLLNPDTGSIDGLTLIITKTEYNDRLKATRIELGGIPDALDVQLALLTDPRLTP